MFYNKHYILLDDADGDGNDLGGGGDTPPVDNSKEQMQLLGNAVQMLAQGMEELRSNQSALTEALAKVAEGAGATPKDAKGAATDALADVDFESMSQKELAEMILKVVESGMDGKLQGGIAQLANRLDDLTARIEHRNADSAVEAAAAKHPDLYEWADEMKGLLKENPTISIERAYVLAKAEHPDKAKKVEAKYAKKPEPKPLFSLMPGNRTGSADGTGKMTPKDAAEKAFDATLAQFNIAGTDGLKIS